MFFQGSASDRKVTLDLSGAAADNPAAMGDPSKTESAWDGDDLVTTWTTEGAIPGTSVTRTETIALGADGTMTITTVRANKTDDDPGVRETVMKGALVAVIFVVAIIAGGVYWATAINTDDVVMGETTYAVAERRTIASTVLATGVIRLRVGAEVRVGSQMSGIVNELNVTVGSKIEQGDIIARIDSRSLEARLAQAEAQVRVLEQEVERARVELARAQELDVKKLVARTEVEDRTLDLADALARLEKSRRDAEVVANGSRLCRHPGADHGNDRIGNDTEGLKRLLLRSLPRRS